MLNRSPKSTAIQNQVPGITAIIDALWSNIAANKLDKLEAENSLAQIKGFLESLSCSTQNISSTSRSHSLLNRHITTLTRSLKSKSTEGTRINRFKSILPTIKYSLELFVAEIQAECDAEYVQKIHKAQSVAALALSPSLPAMARPIQMGYSSVQPASPPSISQAYYLPPPKTPSILPVAQGVQQATSSALPANSSQKQLVNTNIALGSLDKYLHVIHNMSYKKTHPLMLTNLPEPIPQIGPTCGYKGVHFIIEYWHRINAEYSTIPYLLKGPEKHKTASLRGLGKQKANEGVKGLEGIGGIYDVNLFADVLADTDYHGQVVQFDTKDDLRRIITRGLELKCPLLLPVDFPAGLVGKSNGQHAHYVVVVGFQPDDREEKVYYVSGSSFYRGSLHDLFESNRDLKQKPPEKYVKDKKGDEWKGLSIFNSKQSNAEIISYHKTYVSEKIDLNKLNGHALFAYPKLCREKLEKEFANLSLRDQVSATIR